jgi:hypothetical protein
MSRACKLPTPYEGDPPLEKCGTTKGPKGMTLCEGDRVRRVPIKGATGTTFKKTGTVLAVQMGSDNSGKKKLAARVCFDGEKADDLAYPYLFTELRKK